MRERVQRKIQLLIDRNVFSKILGSSSSSYVTANVVAAICILTLLLLFGLVSNFDIV